MVKSKSMLNSIYIFLLVLLGINLAYSAANIVDVTFNERAYEHLIYNPAQTASGEYVDANENRTAYSINGTIFIENTHATEPVQDLVLNITGITNIYNVSNISGARGYVSEFNTGSDYMILTIPDLGAGDNITFRYDVNTTNVAPPMNFTTSYSTNRIFSGLPVTVTDVIQNNLNNTLYTDQCIYDVNITQYALDYNQSGTILNFTFGGPVAGTDNANTGIDGTNRILSWDVQAGACMNFGASTDINYDLDTPAGINVANDYEIINTTMTYSYNNTFSRINLVDIDAIIDMELQFDKYLDTVLTGDNATWRINGSLSNPTDIDVNLTTVSFWVSVRNGTGTGFTNPSIIDNDTISGASLNTTYTPNQLLNSTSGNWDSNGNEWFLNYTYSSSPIVWMDLDHFIINDGVQLTNRSISYGTEHIYIKEIYIATGYWLQISRNITRLNDNEYNVFIKVVNLGTSPTPSGKVVQVYNFIPNTFSLTSPFSYSASTWYSSSVANETLTDPIYNGTMFQFAITEDGNPSSSSLDSYGGTENANNTWTVTYNVTGSGEFNFDDLFLTGVDPLNVEEYGATQAITVEGIYGFVASKIEISLGILATIVGALILFL